MAEGDRNDPRWSWYWAEADREDYPQALYPMVDPMSYRVSIMTDRFGADFVRPPRENSPSHRAFRGIAEWLPTKLREAIVTEFRAPRAKGYEERGILQPTWSRRCDRAKFLAQLLAPVYKRLEDAEEGSASLARAVASSDRPDALRAVVDAGSTFAAAIITGCSQSALHKWCQQEARRVVMLRALMLLRARAGRPEDLVAACFPEPDFFEEEFIK